MASLCIGAARGARIGGGLKRRYVVLLGLATAAAGAALVLSTRGPAPPASSPPGSFAFAALGDSPYNILEEPQYQVVLNDMAAHELSAVVHLGDLFWARCTDARYRRSREELDALPHPVIYTPGDNEWTDCWDFGDAPLERLASLRKIFFADPTHSIGGRRIPLRHQGESALYAEFVENARWTHEGVVFATVHIPGSANARDEAFRDRTAADDSAAARRTEAGAAWLRETFAEARASGAPAVVIAFHATTDLEHSFDDPYRMTFDPFLAALEEEVALFSGPVLAIHGDGHVYTVDHPLTRRSTGEKLEKLTRVQVPGSPAVGWVRVTVTPGAAQPFAFEPRVVPRWKYW